jgi:hypothetical protein
MTLSLTSQATGSFGGIPFNYGFAHDTTSGNYYVAHTAVNALGAIVNPATDDTLSTAVTALTSLETGQASQLVELEEIVTALALLSTATGQANAQTILQAIATSVSASATAAGQGSALTALQAIQASAALNATAAGQGSALSVLQGIASQVSRSLTYTDHSGATSATVGTYTQVAVAANRGYLRVTNNNASGILYVYDKTGGTATTANSIAIGPGQMHEWTKGVTNAVILIAGSVASLAYEAAEGL